MSRRRDPCSPRVVYRTARAGLRVTRGQRRRLLALLASGGDVRACVLEINAWRRARQDRPLVSYQELCRELARAEPGTFGELDTVGARSVLRRYSDAWFATAKRRRSGDERARFPRRRRALVPLRRIGHLINALKDKAEAAGISLTLVDERGTSSTCPACRSRVPKPAGRVLACPACQFTGHRDLSAAASIAARLGGGITPVIPAGVTHRRAGAHLPGIAPSRRDPRRRAHHRGVRGSPGRHRPARTSPTPAGLGVARHPGEEPEVIQPSGMCTSPRSRRTSPTS
jgi:putative transposase-like DNA-binding protein